MVPGGGTTCSNPGNAGRDYSIRTLTRIDSAAGGGSLHPSQDLVHGRELTLVGANPGRDDLLVRVDQECRGSCDVPGVEAEAMPDAVGSKHLPPLVDQYVERQACVLDVTAYRVPRLREHAQHLDAACLEALGVFRELAKLAAAVRSPGAAMKDEQQPSVCKQIRQRSDPSFLIRQRKARCNR